MYNKKTFLIDSENVGTEWKKLLSYKEKRDRIIIFYTDNTPNLTFSDLLEIIQYPDNFETIKCNTGKDALDFQLVSYLGYLLKSSVKTDYYIVSKDAGYDAVCKFWKELDSSISIERIIDSTIPYKKKETKIIEEQEIPAQIIQDVLPTELCESTDMIVKIEETLKSNDQHDYQTTYSSLVKSFGIELGAEIYRTLKPNLSKIYNALN